MPISWLGIKKTKPNTTEAQIRQPKNVLQHKINTKKRKPNLVASYDTRHGNGLLLFRLFINLSFTYLLRHLLAAPGPKRGSTVLTYLNLTQQKHACTNKAKGTIIQN